MKFLKPLKFWTAGCPCGTRPMSQQKLPFSVNFPIVNNRKFLGHRPVDPCLSRRVSLGHPAGVPAIFLSLYAFFYFLSFRPEGPGRDGPGCLRLCCGRFGGYVVCCLRRACMVHSPHRTCSRSSTQRTSPPHWHRIILRASQTPPNPETFKVAQKRPQKWLSGPPPKWLKIPSQKWPEKWLSWWAFRPRQKNFSPPPPPKFPTDTLPTHPSPSPLGDPPPPGIFNENPPFPVASPRTSPSLPRAGKKKISETSTKLFDPKRSGLSHFWGQEVTFRVTFESLWSRSWKPLLGSLWATSNFLGVRGALGCSQHHSAGTENSEKSSCP